MGTARILVVDDEPGILGMLSRALSSQGYEVHVADHAAQALKLVHDMPCFDLLVSDVIMPEMCGPELVKRVVLRCPDIAVVLMSAHVGPETLPAHAKFLSKPFRMVDLYSLVERVLASSRG